VTRADKHDKCIICGGSRLKTKYNVNNFTIAKCMDCTLLFVKEKLDNEQLNAYYEITEQGIVYDDPLNIENLNYYYYQLRDLIISIIPSGRILDVGCSGGFFLDCMSDWERFGVEFPGIAAQRAASRYGENIYQGTFDDFAAPEGFFNVITLQDVFDHLPDPMQALKKCHRLLAPRGIIVIKVHDISSILARIQGRRYYALIPPYHLSYFNKKSLQIALKQTGFSKLFHKYLGHVLFLKTIPYRLSREKPGSFFYRLYSALDKSSLGNIKIYKNLYDIITVFAQKAP
jgi:SAM-dependent methyltransferase